MKLIVGLGNPGKKYENTRHNVGFMFVDYYCTKNNLIFKKKKNSLYVETNISGEKVIIIKPQTFMNNSGTAVKEMADFYKIEKKDILVIYDDTAFDVGNLKVKSSGSSAGHNGIKDIIFKMSTEDIKRVKLGISKNKCDLADYVLSIFDKSDVQKLEKLFETNISLIEDFIVMEFDHLMSKYNIKGE